MTRILLEFTGGVLLLFVGIGVMFNPEAGPQVVIIPAIGFGLLVVAILDIIDDHEETPNDK